MATSTWGLIMNIVNSIVGVSVLTMPFCFKQCGILLGSLLLMLCCWMTHQSCMFLVKSASVSKRRTYAGLAFHAYGKAGKMLVETSMIGLMLGTCIAFYVVIGDLGSAFFARLLGLQVSEGFRVFLLIAVSLCIVLPLSLQRNMMASIQSFSAMALMFYTVFMFVIVLSSFKHGLVSGKWLQQVSYVRWEGIFRCIPIFGMSFACQSQVLPTYDILDEPSVKIMSSIFASSLNVVTIFYITVGFFGYVSFTETIAGNVLVNFNSNLVTEMIQVGFMMSVAVGFPMMILPCRQALNTLLFEQQQQKDGTFAAGGYMPPLRFKVLTLSVVFGTMLGGILIPNVETILGVTGATMGSLICFICPALIYKKIHKKGLSSQFILGVGLVILVISTYATMAVSTQSKSGRQDIGELKNDDIKLDQNLPKISVDKPKVDEPSDEIDKPKLPPQKPEVEQPQIKGPIEVPQQEEGKKKKEEDQLDRPNQGDIAVPVGEAHRHEPPVPREEEAVDERKDLEESNEKQLSQAKEDNALKEAQGKGDIKPEEKEPLLPKEEKNEQAPQQPPQKEGDHKEEKDDNAPIKTEQKEQPLNKEVDSAVKNSDDALDPKKSLEDIVEKEKNDLAELEKALENQLKESEKKSLVAAELEGRDERNAEQKAAENQEDAEKAEILDHAILLQVIKEQQVQQKRLLDQQEKLLEVIKEQHMEIHQQKEEDDEQQEKPEGQAPELARSKEEVKAGGVEIKNVEEQRKPGLQLEPKHEARQNPNVLDREVKLTPPGVQRIVGPPGAQKAKADPPQGPASKQDVPDVKKQPQHEAVIQKQVPQEEGALKDQHKVLPKKEHLNQETIIDKPKDAGAPVHSQDKVQEQPAEVKHSARTLVAKVVQPEKKEQVEKAGLQQGANQVEVQRVNQDSQEHGLAPNPQSEVKHDPRLEANELADDTKIRAKEDIRGGPLVEGAPEHDNGKSNRDLKLQNDLDLRRRKRDLGAEEETEKDGTQIISFHPIPNLKVNDLRGALETRLNQAAEGGLQIIHSRQIKQLTDEKER
ncbi:putative sodium-coupled neutral amino acid transporter 10 isoform X2 [Spea bombifrons]|uniref:putative sodium-coupled neutral amino acid transporter 10 isoform X2 n=1 Tax=Spea bombifrons TaxID=233779 RepID=UPI002349C8FB|nr:putative sodium-coupled neutral amino acid transporter 10 isoform X2 [Spea bombifrons]